MDTDRAAAKGFLVGAGFVGGWIATAWLALLHSPVLLAPMAAALLCTITLVINVGVWLSGD